MKQYRIKDLTTTKFAFVDQAAVPKAYFHFVKRKGDNMTDEQFADLIKRLDGMESRLGAVEKLLNAQHDSDMPDEMTDADEMMKEFKNLQKLFQEGLITEDEFSALLTDLESVAKELV